MLVRGDDGNAIVEFVYLAILMMVPLVYVLLTVFRVKARRTPCPARPGRPAGSSPPSASPDDADARAFAAASIVMADSGLELDAGQLSIALLDAPCLHAGSPAWTS